MQKTKKRRWLRYIIALTIPAIMVVTAIFIIQGYAVGSPVIFPRRNHVFTVDELNFEIGRNRVFAHSGGAVAAAGTFGIQVLNGDGEETLRDTFRMFNPAIVGNAGTFLVFDIGGTAVRVFSANQIINEVETTGPIVSATINRNGWFTLVTHEPGAFRGTVQVYNNRGSVVYRVDLGSGFPVTAKLSENNNNLAILNLTNTGSRVTFYNGIDEGKDPDYQFDIVGTLVFDIRFIGNNELLAISTESILRIGNTGESVEVFNFRGRRIGSYTHGERTIALNLYDYAMGYSGQIITVNIDTGEIIGEHAVNTEVVSMSLSYGQIAVLKSDGIIFLSENMEEYSMPEEYSFTIASNGIIMLGDNLALATGDNLALIVRLTQDS